MCTLLQQPGGPHRATEPPGLRNTCLVLESPHTRAKMALGMSKLFKIFGICQTFIIYKLEPTLYDFPPIYLPFRLKLTPQTSHWLSILQTECQFDTFLCVRCYSSPVARTGPQSRPVLEILVLFWKAPTLGLKWHLGCQKI